MNNKNNQLSTLLNLWCAKRDQQQWVLGTIFEIKGSSYRKPGAMMLFGDLGEQYGLLSGGCLESNLMQHARKVMDSQQAKIVVYDMTDEDDIGWQLGIGCGGVVHILLQPIHAKNNYLELVTLTEHIKRREKVCYAQHITEGKPTCVIYTDANKASPEHCNSNNLDDSADTFPNHLAKIFTKNKLNTEKNSYAVNATLITHKQTWLYTPILPAPHIMIFGGGIDVYPLVEIAHTMGWIVTLVDKRSAYARKTHFPKADTIIKGSASDLLSNNILSETLRVTASKVTEAKGIEPKSILDTVDAIVIMTHNLLMDAEALKVAQQSSAKYVGLLGPIHRRERILKNENLTLADLAKPLSSPIGLDIGGQLPESIALSILSECHQMLYK